MRSRCMDHGVQQAEIQPDERVLVVGAGTIGVLAAAAAKARGARVWISDVAKDKLTYAFKNFCLDGMILNDTPEHFAAPLHFPDTDPVTFQLFPGQQAVPIRFPFQLLHPEKQFIRPRHPAETLHAELQLGRCQLV